jgi:hypothetical protein
VYAGEKSPVAVFRLESLDDRVAEGCGGSEKPEERGRAGAEPAPDRVGATEFAENRNEEDAEGLENSDRGPRAPACPLMRTDASLRPPA